MNKEKAQTQPVKGFRDFQPRDWAVQEYIFSVWKSVCKQYGYEEYNAPVLERAEIYNKSGQDVGTSGKELYNFEDKGGRKLALRPEMTPSVGRMIAEYSKSYAKPIRWFSIAQFFRAEKPQKGRGREFFQLNADIFGDDSVKSDFEIISLAIDIMKKFAADETMFEVRINSREFADYYFKEVAGVTNNDMQTQLTRLIDAAPKKEKGWLEGEIDKIDADLYTKVEEYLQTDLDTLKKNPDAGSARLVQLFDLLQTAGLDKYCVLDTSMARGFDYYTGVVFEVFDKNPENNRSIFGGGRYDDLLDLFGKEKMPAVGFAPGDITTRLFLENWNLLEDKVTDSTKEVTYIPLLSESLATDINQLANKLREEGQSVIAGLEEQGVTKALTYANQRGYGKVILFGEEEKSSNIYKEKDMQTSQEREVTL